jgi:hypothetical protein
MADSLRIFGSSVAAQHPGHAVTRSKRCEGSAGLPEGRKLQRNIGSLLGAPNVSKGSLSSSLGVRNVKRAVDGKPLQCCQCGKGSEGKNPTGGDGMRQGRHSV